MPLKPSDLNGILLFNNFNQLANYLIFTDVLREFYLRY